VGFPNDRRNAAGAIPVYIVPPPLVGPPWPNKQNNGAIPVNFVGPPIIPNGGAIPVYISPGAGPGPKWPNNQNNPLGAMPVYNSPGGMPVWDVGASPPPPIPVNVTLPSIAPVGVQPSGAILTANSGVWTNSPTNHLYQWTRNGVDITSILGVSATLNIYTTTVLDRNTDIGLKVIAQNSYGDSLSVLSSNLVSIMGIPVNIIAPSINPIGPVNVGTGLIINPGTWTNNPMGYYYTWRRNGVSIVGAAMNVYLTTTDDAGTLIDAVILPQNASGNGVGTLTSNQVTVN
jgi:hypothetical protein